MFSVHFPFHSCQDENQTNNGGDDKARLGESKLTMITVNMLMMMLAMIQGDFFHWYSQGAQKMLLKIIVESLTVGH